ncbi:MAG: hypothetical protein IT331_03175 [Anaerolineae bacterium]|nr:hypothetical protein [Anaerolineae bacterium]
MSAVESPQEQAQEKKWIWSPVRQQAADSLLAVFIVAFAVTVIVVRVFLQLSGYPQIGNSTFHIAHLLWGGLLLFVAVVFLLSLANRWVLWVAALLGGVGVGLFIDEVGKFITQDNDYFFPLAFPIIYAFLLVCVWLYLRMRRSQPRDARTLLYNSLEDMKQVLDHDLDPFEHTALVKSLNQVMTVTTSRNERDLAQALLDFVRAKDVYLAREPNWVERLWGWTKFVAARWPSRRVFKWILVGSFVWAGISSLFELSALWTIVSGGLRDTNLPAFVIQSGKTQYELREPTLLLVHGLAIVVTGLMSMLAAVLMLVRKERLGLRFGSLAMILSLTVVSLLTFYFSQLYAIGDALSQLAILSGAAIYRWRFFLNE